MPDPPQPGVQFEIMFPTFGIPFDKSIRVEVVWAGKESKQDEFGVGVKFLEIDYLERELLTRYVMNKLQQIET